MGNAPSSSSRVPLGGSLLEELHDIQYEKSIGASRFLKAIRARHAHGKIVVKTFVKPDASLTLRHLVRRLRKERETLADVPNVLTYQQVVETDRAGYLIRQWLSSSLYDRISTRPFLTTIEKKWVTYQLLFAMKACREHQIPHGDLKTENVIVTTSLSVFVTDFAASFKPTFLPLDDPADFSFFFDTSGRRTCYIAPERFYTADSDIARQKASMRGGGSSAVGNTSITTSSDPFSEILGLGKRDGKVTEAMDVFALGCVIAELWRDGTPTFSLSQLFKYREKQFDLEAAVAEIAEPSVRAMVLEMTALQPEKRATFAHHFEQANQRCFPRSFSAFLHPYLVDLQRFMPPSKATRQAQRDAAAALPRASVPFATTSGRSTTSADHDVQSAILDEDLVVRRQADVHIDRLWSEWSVIIDYLNEEEGVVQEERSQLGGDEDGFTHGEREAAEHSLPAQLGIPGIPSSILSTYRRHPLEDDGPALVILSPLLANLRNALRATSKLRALDLLLHLSAGWLTDEAKLDRVLPYVVALYDDSNANVRAASIRASVQILLLVDGLTPANENVCSEYVFPNLRRLASDPSPMVRTAYAGAFSHLITAAERFIQQGQALQASGALAADQDGYDDLLLKPTSQEASYDAQMQDLRAFAQDQVTTLLTDPNAAVKRALLTRIDPICHLFGPAATNDVLLSHMITYLNDRDWLLRDAFFDAIISVALVGGARSVDEYIVPLMLQALADAEEAVTVRVLDGLARLITSSPSLLAKTRLYELIAMTQGFLCHANLWIRQSEARFLEAAFATLDTTDTWIVAYPSLRPLLKHDMQTITAASLLETAKPPLSRNILNAALVWAGSANKTSFWTAAAESQSKAGLADGLGNEGLHLISGTSVAKTPIPRTDEDDGYMDKLRAQGLTVQDETKLFALRDYLWRLASGAGRRRMGNSESSSDLLGALPSDRAPGVQTLEGVTPQTIFFTHNSSNNATGATSSSAGTVSSSRAPSIAENSDPSSRRLRPPFGSHRVLSDGSYSQPGREELRRRMASTSSAWGSLTPRLPQGSALASTRAASSVSSPRSVSSQTTRLGISKASPAVAEISTTATGTMSELSSRLQSVQVGDSSEGRGSETGGNDGRGDVGSDARTARPSDAPFVSTYNGSDPHIQAHLEAVFVRNFRDRALDLAPKVSTSRRRPAGGRVASSQLSSTSSTAASGSAGMSRRPEGKLIAYFNEDTSPITSIAVSSDHIFFASGSEDGTIKVWDCARLEKNVTSRSRITYGAHQGRITALLALTGTHCLVSTATDGSLHVWRVDVAAGSLPRYGKPRLVSNFQLSTPGEYVTAVMQSSASASGNNGGGDGSASTSPSTAPMATRLILGTSQSRITILDLRTMQVLQALRNPAHLGPITCMCADKRRLWLLVGTLGGSVVLWDLRFGLLVKSWRVGPAAGAAGDVKVTGCEVHPSKGRGRWVLVSCEAKVAASSSSSEAQAHTLIETWDIDRGVLVEAYECGPGGKPSERRAAETAGSDVGLSSPAAAIERLLRLRDEREEAKDGGKAGAALPQPSSNVKSFLVGVEGYSSGPLANVDTSSSGRSKGGSEREGEDVGGSWLDAGKLAAEADESGQRSAASSAATTGPAGYLLSGGEDCKIRFWDLGRPERSVVFGAVEDGIETSAGKPSSSSPAFQLSTSSAGPMIFHHRTDVQKAASAASAGSTLRSPLLSQQQTQPAQAHMRAHRDAITALAVIEFPFRCVVAGDRTGAVKVWE
ncbi:WD40 repeat-like protein [Jaminaea rosea]|uniref:non-specific serine/threonine protein kinase n=1 Tax=Jaminaea rosea TaxID=1569628 RepID=A0A316UJW6_9BASI|nr:WD40 repeat-like protein [Jaminaea rosea]PWN25582.1 WD40 repeat-like protein [Jaminaea rosea]